MKTLPSISGFDGSLYICPLQKWVSIIWHIATTKHKRHMQRIKTSERKTTVGGFKRKKKLTSLKWVAEQLNILTAFTLLKTPLELEFTSAEASRLTPCDWQTETLRVPAGPAELATSNSKVPSQRNWNWVTLHLLQQRMVDWQRPSNSRLESNSMAPLMY